MKLFLNEILAKFRAVPYTNKGNKRITLTDWLYDCAPSIYIALVEFAFRIEAWLSVR